MDFRFFLQQLNEDKQLTRYGEAVSCDQVLAALCRREFQRKDGGRALLFDTLVESEYRCAANLFGNEHRLLRLLGCPSLGDFSRKINAAVRAPSTASAAEIPGQADDGVTELTLLSAVDLMTLPAIRSWPGEQQRYLTLGLALTRDPETGKENLGLYRAQIVSKKTLALNFAPGSGADKHWQKAKRLRQALPVALIFGSDPVFLWAAAAPLPDTDNEIGFCRRAFGLSPVFTPCSSQPLSVPADAELVIEGFIGPQATCHEGPFGNHTGQYVSRADCPLLRVTGIMSRPQPILPVTIVGPPPSENVYLAKANEILILHQLKQAYPQILDLKMPMETAFHGVSLLQLRNPTRRANRELVEQLWSRGPLRRSKFIVLLDEDISLNTFSRCWWRAINMLQRNRLYRNGERLAVDATGVDHAALVREDPQIAELLNRYPDNH